MYFYELLHQKQKMGCGDMMDSLQDELGSEGKLQPQEAGEYNI